jgi:hypothetical protein
MSINITVNGRLTKDLELRRTQTGKLVTNFGLAHNFRERAGNQFNDVVTVFFDEASGKTTAQPRLPSLASPRAPVSPSRASGPSGLGPPGPVTFVSRRTDGSQDPVVH